MKQESKRKKEKSDPQDVAASQTKKEIVPKLNLLEEPWIRVRNLDGLMEEVSLLSLFEKAHTFEDLAGETQVQNFALMRVLLAICLRAMSTWNVDGEEEILQTTDDALDRWEAYWDQEEFPEEVFAQYLKAYQDRFWLIHPETPFWQSPEAEIGTEYGAGKLLGDLSESSNKVRLFSNHGREGKESMSLAEAARWVIALSAYDDTSAKPKRKGAPSPGAGWLGQIGQVYAKGGTLFETLMLNTILLKDGDLLWPSFVPAWEKPVSKGERIEILQPQDLCELMTVASRRILLLEEDGRITGYKILGGDFFPKTNCFTEQYTLWRPVSDQGGKSKKRAEVSFDFNPKRHNPSRQVWRDFANFVSPKTNDPASQKEPHHQPGIVSWMEMLTEAGSLPDGFHARFETAGVQYGDKDFFVNDLIGDSIEFSADLLTKTGSPYRDRIVQEIDKCEAFAKAAGILCQEVSIASGGTGESLLKNAVRKGQETAYESLSLPFKRWISSVDIQEDLDKQKREWAAQAMEIARQVANTLTQDYPPKAVMGRTIVVPDAKNKEIQNKYLISVPAAKAKFRAKTLRLYQEEPVEKESENGTTTSEL